MAKERKGTCYNKPRKRAGVTQVPKGKPERKKESEPESHIEEKEIWGDRRGFLKLCGKIHSPDPKNDCYEKIALKTNDPDACSKMAEEKELDYPTTKRKWICWRLVAKQTENSAICDNIKNDFVVDCKKTILTEETCLTNAEELPYFNECKEL